MTCKSKSFKPSRMLTNFHIKGFQYWDGPLILSKLNVSDKIELVAESDNPHDASAVALYSGDAKLGYVPSDETHMLSTLLFYGHSDIVEAVIMQIDLEEDPWKQVRVGIYVRNALKDELSNS